MRTIVRMKFGSFLYGTADENSDTDFKGVFLPSREEILLGRIPKSHNTSTKKGNNTKNSKDDVDTEIYSLHYFLELACDGETVALDMLHAPNDMILEREDIWDRIVANRAKFYTRNLKAFIGYARRQASKYGIRGSRLNDAQRVLDFLSRFDSELKLRTVWDRLPELEHVRKTGPNPINSLEEYQVCGKKFQETTRIGYVVPIITSFLNEYGERARKAANNEGVDWKACSHALRAAYQVREILTEGTITFPLRDAPYLKEIKQGKRDYTTDFAPTLETVMSEVEELSEKSLLPLEVDRKYWDKFLIETLMEAVFNE